MRIKEINEKKEVIITKRRRIKDEDFKSILKQGLTKKLDNLLEEIDNQTNLLKENMNFATLNRYKELVKEFLKEVISVNYYIEEKIGISKDGKHVFNIIRCVNEELENLTKLFLEEQKDVLTILAKLDQIRGLLIDIYK